MNSATAAMLDGIKDACDAWGRAMRWVIQSTGEGYPSVSTFERARGGELSANDVGTVRQKFGEVMLGDALAVSLAIRMPPGMPEQMHRVLFMHYVVPRKDANRDIITVDRKATELGFTDRRAYYTVLDQSHHFLLARIDMEVNSPRGTNSQHSVRTVSHS
jgi:hypothetical protein